MSLRDQMLKSNGCEFDTTVTADYGDEIYTFQMHCTADADGNVTFTVIAPETIAGISGTITDHQGSLTFDDRVLAFPMLADEQLTPVSAPWILIKTLRGGYINASAQDENGMRILIDDSYLDNALQLDIRTDSQDFPIYAQILWKGTRILSLTVSNFTFL